MNFAYLLLDWLFDESPDDEEGPNRNVEPYSLYKLSYSLSRYKGMTNFISIIDIGMGLFACPLLVAIVQQIRESFFTSTLIIDYLFLA